MDAEKIAPGLSRSEAVQQAINDFNAAGHVETYFDSVVPIRARQPILATDCDYEIVRISGVQGMRLPAIINGD